jgi:4'-phosphopantetheinyl transferase EntD
VIEEILPACVAAVEAWHDCADAELFPEEEALLGRAVEKRRREFTTARMCARAALGRLGQPPASILTGERGEPLWPVGVVGSITHCDGYRACAVARLGEILTIGIDAEPNAALPDGLLGDIARPEELPSLRRLGAEHPHVHWDRLLFSAKESVYKAWFPLAKRWLGFEDATLTLDPSAGTFTARLLVEGPLLSRGPLHGFSGRWTVDEGIVATAIAVSSG